jgi:hypothetical protein
VVSETNTAVTTGSSAEKRNSSKALNHGYPWHRASSRGSLTLACSGCVVGKEGCAPPPACGSAKRNNIAADQGLPTPARFT